MAKIKIVYEALGWILEHRAPRNPKAHNHKLLADSIRRFGFTIPIAINEETQTIVAGHGRAETLQRMKDAGEPMPERIQLGRGGDWMVPVIRGLSFATDADAEAYLLADNRHTEGGGWDTAMLREMLADMKGIPDGLVGVGWDDAQVMDLLADREPPEDFKSYDGSTKETIHCPKCGFPITTE